MSREQIEKTRRETLARQMEVRMQEITARLERRDYEVKLIEELRGLREEVRVLRSLISELNYRDITPYTRPRRIYPHPSYLDLTWEPSTGDPNTPRGNTTSEEE